MSGAPQPEREPKRNWNPTLWGKPDANRRWTWKSTLGLVLIVILIDGIAGGGSLMIVPLLVIFGWIPFLMRVSGEWRWSPEGILTFAVCTALLTIGAHLFLRRLRRSMDPAATPWRARWTVSLAALVVVLFGAGVATLGVVHQTSWLARERWHDDSHWHKAQSLLHQLGGEWERNPMTPAQIGTWLRTRLPEWRVVVLPADGGIGAVVIGEERGGRADEVTVAIVPSEKPRPEVSRERGRWKVSRERGTTVAREVVRASALIEAFAAGKAAAPSAPEGLPLPASDPQPPIPDPR
ncbi:MAG: sulfite exporter TauE/SafE family protein [Planctomycetes bacterium]|nr:sulfite exporter TauE/SafE family protein [Planctomycetota bacterium]